VSYKSARGKEADFGSPGVGLIEAQEQSSSCLGPAFGFLLQKKNTQVFFIFSYCQGTFILSYFW